MAIYIIEGKPRTGKSYYLIRTIATTYYNRSKKGKLTLKDDFKGVKILTNIDGCKIPGVESLQDAIDSVGSVDRFFSREFQESIFKKHKQVVYVIDEAQDYFPSKYSNEKVFSWFRYHGHWGQEIYLGCHGLKLLPYNISNLAESVVRTMPQGISLTGGKELYYSNIVSGEKTDTFPLIKRKWVFDLYKSQEVKSVNKQRSPFLKYGIGIGVAVLFILYKGYTFFHSFDAEKKESPAVSSSPSRSSLGTNRKTVSDEIVRYKLDYLTQDNQILIFYDDDIYPIAAFPYPVSVSEFSGMHALIPSSKLPKKEEKEEKEERDVMSSTFSFGDKAGRS